jgi:stage II sporulation protein D
MGVFRRGAVVALTAAMVAGTLGGALARTPAAAVSTDESYWIPADRQVTVTGHGYGHGHGMSQHGAQGAALQGLTYRQIVDFYYPGTGWSKVTGKVRVLITADTTDDVVVSPAPGLSVRDLAARTVHELPVRDEVSRWRLHVRDGQTVVQLYSDRWRPYKAAWAQQIAGDAEFFARGPLTLWMPSGARTYRGALRAASPSKGSSARDTVNVVTMDQYVRGVVPYEIPVSWHPEAVKAQAVAARTYATWSRSQNPSRHYQICDTTACQVYNGTRGEDPRSNTAVRATSREILTHGGKPAFTQFSASSGGWTAAGSAPYLVAQRDPYDGWSGNSVHTWRSVVNVSTLERRYPTIGTLRRIRVTSRDGNGDWRGRVNSLVLDGTSGTRTITGDDFRWAFGLRSRWFTIEPTPIIARWTRIGGVSSPVGDVRAREYAVAAGVAQRFERGRIFWSRRTGARELYGKVLTAYTKHGGPRSNLGFPRTAVQKRGVHRWARFQKGSIYFKRPDAPVVVTGAIDRRFIAEGGLTSGLGWPTTSSYDVPGGQRADYEHGFITWNRKTGTTTVTRS